MKSDLEKSLAGLTAAEGFPPEGGEFLFSHQIAVGIGDFQ